MITLTIDEATLNATRAALDERVNRLEATVGALQESENTLHYAGRRFPEDAQRALVWNIAALHETKLAQEFYAEVEPGTDYPVDASYHDWQAVGPR